jgi:hypothetical protein
MFHVEHPRPSPNVRYRTLSCLTSWGALCVSMLGNVSRGTSVGEYQARNVRYRTLLPARQASDLFMRLEMFHVEHLVVASSSRLAMGGVGLIPAASLHRHRQVLDGTFEICSTWNIRRIACNTKRKGESHQLSTTGTPAKHRIRQSWRGIHMFSTAATSSAQPSTVASRFSAR